MATKKTGKKKRTKLKKETIATKGKRVKKPVAKKRAKKKAASKKKPVSKKAAPKAKARRKKRATMAAARTGARPGNQISDVEALPRVGRRSRSAGQSGDLQGLSDVERADSESVDELLEEGNAFEADVVAGVQSADDADESEVHTHEVPEDDVPEEYLEKD